MLITRTGLKLWSTKNSTALMKYQDLPTVLTNPVIKKKRAIIFNLALLLGVDGATNTLVGVFLAHLSFDLVRHGGHAYMYSSRGKLN
jgi:hypothetical protein